MEARMVKELAVFASRYGISHSDAHVLPTLFDNAAEKVGMAPRALLAEATFRNAALGEYLASAAAVAAEAARQQA